MEDIIYWDFAKFDLFFNFGEAAGVTLKLNDK